MELWILYMPQTLKSYLLTESYMKNTVILIKKNIFENRFLQFWRLIEGLKKFKKDFDKRKKNLDIINYSNKPMLALNFSLSSKTSPPEFIAQKGKKTNTMGGQHQTHVTDE